MNGRIAHDAALAMAHALLDVLKPNIRQEDWRLAVDEFYAICRAGIEAYELQQNRMQQRMKPTSN